MMEDLFVKVFGLESSLRMLYALHIGGESSLYKIFQTLDISPGFTRKAWHDQLMLLVALGLVKTRKVEVQRVGTRLRTHPEISRTHHTYQLDPTHPLNKPLTNLLTQAAIENERAT